MSWYRQLFASGLFLIIYLLLTYLFTDHTGITGLCGTCVQCLWSSHFRKEKASLPESNRQSVSGSEQ